jgi:DNA polymerase-3 subunit epsilon
VSLPESLVLIDVETTGANPVHDRVTEIAVLRVERGEVVDRWQSLVNPQRSIPPLIQRLIGITDDMVAGAPSFAELADGLRARLEGAVFVAHNARFDYGFIRNEFARLEQGFDAPVLCTVKLSRALYPEHHRHGLDALIARHAFNCDARHRAMGDAEVLWQFARLVTDAFPEEVLARACERAMKLPARPAGLPDGVLEGLPDATGVYYFYGDNDLPLYIGKSVSLRARVMEHFAAGGSSGKDAALARKVRRVEWEETAGELEAMLRESMLVKLRQPLHNRQLREDGEVFGLRLVPGRKRAPILERVPLGGTDPASWEGLHGTFRSRKESDNLLRALALHYRLCPRRLGLEPGSGGACLAHQIKRCAGVCAGKESFAGHDQRLLGALASVTLRAWPWDGPVVVAERAEHSGREAFHLLDRWCHLGSADSMEALQAMAPQAVRRFDLDIYRILVRWFAADANREAARAPERP